LVEAKFFVDNNKTCDYLLDASTQTKKHQNGPTIGFIEPHISPNNCESIGGNS